MSKLIWSIVGIIMLVFAFTLPAMQSWRANAYNLISLVNSGFFSVMPSWFNFLIGTLILAMILGTIRRIRQSR